MILNQIIGGSTDYDLYSAQDCNAAPVFLGKFLEDFRRASDDNFMSDHKRFSRL